MKKIISTVRAFGTILSLLFLCSCATRHHPSAIVAVTELPADVTLNKEVARGSRLIVTVRLENGEELPFDVDTGSPMTLFDKSLEPELGQCLGTVTLLNFGTKTVGGVYKAPKLYLGGTPLMMNGNAIVTSDFQPLSANAGRPIKGVLGMDVLENYCIQLDFEGAKMRFLNPDHLKDANLGKPFPISFSSEGQSMSDATRPYIHHGCLIGGEGTNLLIDTGYAADGALESGLFRREIMEHGLREGDAVHGRNGRVWFAECVWNGEIYTNLLVGEGGNLIGLRFLSRHLVTLDFPSRTLYLKQTSIGPLTNAKIDAAEAFLHNLKENGQLPGWPTNDKGTIYGEALPGFEQFDGRKYGDPSTYHYQVARTSDGSTWKLQKAWRTDQDDNMVEEFPVP